ncbi:hypothetical protein [Mangrovimonas cancribranchiae]|uniref:Nitrogen regulatory protein P-II n=1 Tax=Mangrovimonas cancribranchiae TaxID=3080055 RepID=A0AAU6P0S7_9FLAO
MKLVIITLVDEYKETIYQLFKQSNINDFNESDIAGFKLGGSSNLGSNWFAGQKFGADSELFFFFAEQQNIDLLFKNLKAFNTTIEEENGIRAVVVPVEQFI